MITGGAGSRPMQVWRQTDRHCILVGNTLQETQWEGGGLQVPGPKYCFLGAHFELSGINDLENLLSNNPFPHLASTAKLCILGSPSPDNQGSKLGRQRSSSLTRFAYQIPFPHSNFPCSSCTSYYILGWLDSLRSGKSFPHSRRRVISLENELPDGASRIQWSGSLPRSIPRNGM